MSCDDAVDMQRERKERKKINNTLLQQKSSVNDAVSV